jgi:hypothetical protein
VSLPERINAIKTVTYDVPAIVESLEQMGMEDIDLEVVMEFIQEWVFEDFGGDSGIIFQDENGGGGTVKQYRIVLPLEVWGEFEDDEDHEFIKEVLGDKLDGLLISTDYLWDYWKDAKVEPMEG